MSSYFVLNYTEATEINPVCHTLSPPDALPICFLITTRTGLLDELNRLGFTFRWVTRLIPLDKTAANHALSKLRRQWFAKRKSIVAILREVLYNEPTPLLDSDADNKADRKSTRLNSSH